MRAIMASDLGWGVGCWPQFFDYDNRTFWLEQVEREAHNPKSGNIVSVVYRCGQELIRVYND